MAFANYSVGDKVWTVADDDEATPVVATVTGIAQDGSLTLRFDA